MHGTIGAAAERTEDHDRRLGGANTKRKPPTKTPRVHDVQSMLKMGLGFSKEDRDNWPLRTQLNAACPLRTWSSVSLRTTVVAWLSLCLACGLKEFYPSALAKSCALFANSSRPTTDPVPPGPCINIIGPQQNTAATFREGSEDTFSTWEFASRTTRPDSPGPTVPNIFLALQMGQRSLFFWWQCGWPSSLVGLHSHP